MRMHVDPAGGSDVTVFAKSGDPMANDYLRRWDDDARRRRAAEAERWLDVQNRQRRADDRAPVANEA